MSSRIISSPSAPSSKKRHSRSTPLSLDPAGWKRQHTALLRIGLLFSPSCYSRSSGEEVSRPIHGHGIATDFIRNHDAYTDLLDAVLSPSTRDEPSCTAAPWYDDLLGTWDAQADLIHSQSHEAAPVISRTAVFWVESVLACLVTHALRALPGIALERTDSAGFDEKTDGTGAFRLSHPSRPVATWVPICSVWCATHPLLAVCCPKSNSSALCEETAYLLSLAQESLSRNAAAAACPYLFTAHGDRVYLLQLRISREALDARLAVVDGLGQTRGLPSGCDETLVVAVKGRWQVSTGAARWSFVNAMADMLPGLLS
ncbi:hypothetical protein FN846DRAFT_918520 [Sphaerosporella brunnea]|uniref:Uncharacterized protein n=1 Tax=Sphaerosporella brunnea TaxID=1250544 RepID=A0A5J5EZ81_9PEZI|nr:hypothetical protein FN846DRAFT_918520 [Sphaerosporella brunnea]